MIWDEIKRAYPIGDIRNWVVMRFPPYPARMDDNNLGLDAILEINHFPNPPFKHLELGDIIKCVVIDHSPVDRKIRLSALAEDLLNWQQFVKE